MANPRCLVGAAALICAGLCAPAVEAALTMTQTSSEITVTSSLPPSWKIVFGLSNPGGGSVKSLFRPSNSSQNLTGIASIDALRGLDNLEWRYISGGKGFRSGIHKATLTSVDIVENTANRIVIQIKGKWSNIESFTKTITIDPEGYSVQLSAKWTGGDTGKSMWWQFSNFKESVMDGNNVKVSDADTNPIPLPIKSGNIFSLPSSISLPYTIHFPLLVSPNDVLRLTISNFAGTSGPSRGYEYDNAWGSFWTYFPRWVSTFTNNRTYQFDYRWDLSGDGGGTLPPATVIVSPAVGTDLVEGQTYTFSGTGENLVWIYDGISDGQGPDTFGTGQSATFTAPKGISGVIIILSGDGGTVQQTYNIVPGANTPPTATFSHSPNPAFVGDTVSFDASGSLGGSGGAITSYTWDLGDGTAVQSGPSLSNVTHVYTSAGTYDVTLIVTDATGSDTVTVRLVIGEPDVTPPVIGLTALAFVGTVDDATISSVTVDGAAVSTVAGTFSAEVPVGTTLETIPITATDAAGNTSTRTLAVQP